MVKTCGGVRWWCQVVTTGGVTTLTLVVLGWWWDGGDDRWWWWWRTTTITLVVVTKGRNCSKGHTLRLKTTLMYPVGAAPNPIQVTRLLSIIVMTF